MSRELHLFVAVMGATVGGSMVAALVVSQFMSWSKTRDLRKLLGPAAIALWVVTSVYFVFFPGESDGKTDLLTFGAAGIIGALLASRAIFGMVRYTRHETAGDKDYRGSMRDLLMLMLAFVPVLGTLYLLH